MTAPVWQAQALCAYAVKAGYALHEDWYAPATEPAHHAALEICKQCPVADLCNAQGDYERHGIWGGRYREPDTHRNDSIVHGTEAGAAKHRRRGEKPCRPCLNASNRADNDRRKAVA